jgi:hypothetical protein
MGVTNKPMKRSILKGGIMKKTMSFGIVLCVLFLSSLNAFAYIYASAVPEYLQGLKGDGTAIDPARTNPDNALGAPDLPAIGGVNYLSLGIGGSAKFTFGTPFISEIIVFETTSDRTYPEWADIYVGTSADVFVARISNAIESTVISFAGGPFDYLRIVDVTALVAPASWSAKFGDGFDINAVGVNPVPIPTAAWLLGTGLVGLVGIRRKFRK